MTTSLRSRLWWSYSLVTAAALAVVALILIVYIVQNPATYRQANARLTVVATLVNKNEARLVNLNAAELQASLEQADQTYDVRAVVYNNRRQVLADSRADQQSLLPMPLLPRLRPSSVVKDQSGHAWLYHIQRLGANRWLMVAVPRPIVPLLAALSDELVVPIFIAAIIALLISLLASFWLARWIGEPLQRVVAASRAIPSAGAKQVSLDGPQEVQELARAFNEMNARVAASQDSQRQFVANVSHELKTPLTSIQGFAQALLEGAADSPEARQQAARVIYQESERMNRLVLDLLELARLEAGTLELQNAPVDLPALLRNIAEKFSLQAQAAGVTIDTQADDLPAVRGDGDRLAQVFTNLVDNAVKNTPAGGQVTLKACQDGAQARVEVIDTGTGIPPAALPHIFERFYQADPARAGGIKHGTGLGLAIVKEIVAAHGGKIEVRSTQQPDPKGTGVGSEFIIRLPLATSDTTTPVGTRKKK